jgi:hypothetical protein
MRQLMETDVMKGPIANTVEQLAPVDWDAFLRGRFATAHFTSIGACVQDLSLAPCPPTAHAPAAHSTLSA